MTDHDLLEPQLFAGTQVRTGGQQPLLVNHRLKVTAIEGPDRGRSWEVHAPRIAIGTGGSNDVVLTDTMVSRHHCQVMVREEKYILVDLESTNGTYLDDTPIIETFLGSGTRIQVGQSELLFESRKKWVRLQRTTDRRLGSIESDSKAMRTLLGVLKRVAPTELSCAIIGETGAGKEVAARAIHSASKRSRRPFVVVDCASLTETLFASDLFGHVQGAFTGADHARMGAFELANGGTLFLDEVGELPLSGQPMLLRALERREVKRIGADAHTDVDVRVLSATHRDLEGMVGSGSFRDDLYYRLTEVMVTVPPLRERLEDLPLLAQHIIDDEAKHGCPVTKMSKDALEELLGRRWAGNVRELRNVLRRALVLCSSDTLELEDLMMAEPVRRPPRRESKAKGEEPVDEATLKLPLRLARRRWVASLEKQYLIHLMETHDGDLRRVAEDASLHPKSVRRLLQQHDIDEGDAGGSGA